MSITRTCRISGKEFTITDRELSFLDSISPVFDGKKYPLLPPTLCPEERMRRRLSWRNSFSLYKDNCPISWKDIITSYNPRWGYLWVDQETWWTKGEGLDYGGKYDENSSFFKQYNVLLKKTPIPCLSNSYTLNENSHYVNGTINVKDCYLIFNASNSEHCEYAETVNKSENIYDSSYVFESSQCYECIGINRCSRCIGVEESEDCRDSYFLYDCRGCSHCILCTNLENQSYCIKNQKVSEEEFEQFLSTMSQEDGTIHVEDLENELNTLKEATVKNNHIIGSENCDGIFIKFSKDVINWKNLTGAEDVMHTWQMNYVTRCYDCFSWWWGSVWSPGAENCYECHAVGSGAYGLIGCWAVWDNTRNVYYSYSCIGCQDCFGCVWLRNKQYCILNTQYTKWDYEKLVGKIVEKMTQDGEWWEYPPSSMSTFSYNESYAQLEYPLTEEETITRGYKWYPEETPWIPLTKKLIPWEQLPKNISATPDDILNWVIKCKISGKYFRITASELEFYRKHRLPIPTKHPDVRRKERFERRI